MSSRSRRADWPNRRQHDEAGAWSAPRNAAADSGRVGAGRRKRPQPEVQPIANLLWSRPGFLIRRLHQIHTAMFVEACREFGITPVQYSLLSVVRDRPGLDQVSLAQELGIDRSNATDVMKRLQGAGLIRRAVGERDRRTKATFLTPKGRALLRRIDPIALQAHDDLIASLPPGQRRVFLTLLQRLVADKNELGRAPLKIL